MESELLKLAVGQGIFAVLFVVLLLYVLRENSHRELKYQEIIAELSEIIGNKISCIPMQVKELLQKIK